MARPDILNIPDYWRIIRRRKMIILAATIIIGGTVFYHNFALPPIYRANSQVMVEWGKSMATGMPEYFNPWEGDFVDTQTDIIQSEPIAEGAAKILGWITDSSTSEEIHDGTWRVLGGISNVERVRTTNLIEITVESSDPNEAAAIANALAKSYQEWSLQKRNQRAHTVRVFVQEQLSEIKKRLSDSEEALKKFKESSNIAAALPLIQQELVRLELDLVSLLEEYTELHPDVIDTRARIAELKDRLGINPEVELKYTQLQRSVDTDVNLYSLLKERFEESRILEAENISGVTLVNPAVVPFAPVGPRVVLNTIIGTVVGLLLGLVLAFVKENVDTSISTIEEVEDFLQLPILGVIPAMDVKIIKRKWISLQGLLGTFLPPPSRVSKYEARKMLALLGGGTSPPAEAYKTLRANIQFALSQKKGQVLMFTSSGPHEGKTITAANTAIAFAQNGNKVLLASADLRREMISELFGVRLEPGLADMVSGDVTWQKASRSIEDLMVGELDTARLLETPGIDNLTIITGGRIPPNPAEFLQSEQMKNFIAEVRKHFDYVILDCPPVLPVSDSLVLAPLADGVIFVYQSGQTARGALKRAKSMMFSAKANVLGVVLNAIKAQEMKLAPSLRYYGGYYGGKYGYGYSYEAEKHKDIPWWQFWKRYG